MLAKELQAYSLPTAWNFIKNEPLQQYFARILLKCSRTSSLKKTSGCLLPKILNTEEKGHC